MKMNKIISLWPTRDPFPRHSSGSGWKGKISKSFANFSPAIIMSIWEKWNEASARSTGIKKDMETVDADIHNSDDLKHLYDIHYPVYESLCRTRLKPV